MKPKSALLLALAMFSFLSGAAGQHYYPDQVFSPADIVFTIVGTLLIYYWFRIDAAEHLYRRSALLNVGVVTLCVVALPYYLLRSRGGKRGAAAIGLFALCVLASTALDYAGQAATDGLRAVAASAPRG